MSLTGRVELVVAVGPGELAREAREGVEQCPGDDDHVVDGDESNDDYGTVAETLKGWCHTCVSLGWSKSRVLSDDKLEEEDRQTHRQEHKHERYEEGTCEGIVAMYTHTHTHTCCKPIQGG